MLELTGEVFATEEARAARQELYASTAWSCKYSGRGGLTFEEARAEERKALAALAKVRGGAAGRYEGRRAGCLRGRAGHGD